MKDDIMKHVLAIVGLVFFVGCSTSPRVIEGEYVVCEHLYDSDRNIITRHFNNIQGVPVADCPDIVKDINGSCPELIKIITIDNRIEWLTQREFENYECEKHKETEQ
jgi:hypothetical protein